MMVLRKHIGNWAIVALLLILFLIWPIGARLGVKPFWLVLTAIPFAALGVWLCP